ncbi:asparagine synthase-domain-containing protein [Baffinella frigidus]|nr:asparagine synthase-domain-containing protein [Cryptophyta sp. CCMP2293]
MFSGGLDSTVLAALAHRHVPAGEAIDLINVCFDPREAPDRYTGVEALRELRAMDFNIGTALWFGSRGVGTLHASPWLDTKEPLRPPAEPDKHREDTAAVAHASASGTLGAAGDGCPAVEAGANAAVGVVAGGGEMRDTGGGGADGVHGGCGGGANNGGAGDESSLRGAEAGAVSGGTQNGGGVRKVGAAGVPAIAVPKGGEERGGALRIPTRQEVMDAVAEALKEDPNLSAKEAHAAVQVANPGWTIGSPRVRPILGRLLAAQGRKPREGGGPTRGGSVEGGVYVAGTATDPRQKVYGRREHPLQTVLGEGTACKSGASILLCGMGADEQLCGYSRYRIRARKGGPRAVRADMEGDMRRIWTRNLGRDDRCLSDHSREARFPFLDETVVSFLASLPLASLADLSLPPGVGDKLLLRKGASVEVKRAIQFGTRIAKQSNIATFGSNRQARGDAAVQL